MDSSDSITLTPEELQRLTPTDTAELQKFVQSESQKANIQQTVHGLTEKCFIKCVSAGSSGSSSWGGSAWGATGAGKLQTKEEECVRNCVERFMDSNLAVLRHLERLRAGQ
jgi:mitochondrial import inner membrane translocase subunit TIM8